MLVFVICCWYSCGFLVDFGGFGGGYLLLFTLFDFWMVLLLSLVALVWWVLIAVLVVSVYLG